MKSSKSRAMSRNQPQEQEDLFQQRDIINRQLLANVGASSKSKMKDGGRKTLARRQRILVVDDEPGVCEAIREVLSQRFEVDCAYEAKSGLALAREHHPDLILLDIILP